MGNSTDTDFYSIAIRTATNYFYSQSVDYFLD